MKLRTAKLKADFAPALAAFEGSLLGARLVDY